MSSEEQSASPGGFALYMSPEGWISTPGPDGSTLHFRLQQIGDDGRLQMTDLLVTGAPVTADLLRKIQPGRIEAGYGSLLAAARHEQQPDGASDPWGFVAWKLGTAMAKTLASPRADADLTLGTLRASIPSSLPSPPPRAPLGRPDGGDPEGFYRQVAEAYRSAATESRRPAAVLAEEAGVPVTTVHRWVREARRRGFLPTGQKGKAG